MDISRGMLSSSCGNALRRRLSEPGRTPFDGLRPWSAITHGIGMLSAIAGAALLAHKTAPLHEGIQFAGFIVFSATLVLLYAASTVYHSARIGAAGRIALRKIDHAAVFYLIAGTYTPLCLTALRGPGGFALLGLIWLLAGAGTVMAFAWINAPRKVCAAVYIAMGWLSVSALPFIYRREGIEPIIYLLAGGLLYTIGGVSYAMKWPGRDNPRFGCHEIFHVFIVLGSIAHYLMIYNCLA